MLFLTQMTRIILLGLHLNRSSRRNISCGIGKVLYVCIGFGQGACHVLFKKCVSTGVVVTSPYSKRVLWCRRQKVVCVASVIKCVKSRRGKHISPASRAGIKGHWLISHRAKISFRARGFCFSRSAGPLRFQVKGIRCP